MPHQPKRAVLEIAQATMNELRRGRGRARAKIVLLQQQHAQATAPGIAGDARAVDAAADGGAILAGHEMLIRSAGGMRGPRRRLKLVLSFRRLWQRGRHEATNASSHTVGARR